MDYFGGRGLVGAENTERGETGDPDDYAKRMMFSLRLVKLFFSQPLLTALIGYEETFKGIKFLFSVTRRNTERGQKGKNRVRQMANRPIRKEVLSFLSCYRRRCCKLVWCLLRRPGKYHAPLGHQHEYMSPTRRSRLWRAYQCRTLCCTRNSNILAVPVQRITKYRRTVFFLPRAICPTGRKTPMIIIIIFKPGSSHRMNCHDLSPPCS